MRIMLQQKWKVATVKVVGKWHVTRDMHHFLFIAQNSSDKQLFLVCVLSWYEDPSNEPIFNNPPSSLNIAHYNCLWI